MNPPSPQPRPAEAHTPGLSLGDLQYIFFRHKWLILAVFLLGLGGAVGIWFLKPPMYQSEAQLLIRYVMDDRSTAATSPNTQIMSPDSGRGENIMNSERLVISSYDLAAQVAEAIGPEKILAMLGGGNEKVRAAAVIQKNLIVDVPNRSNILLVRFRHPDPAIAQAIVGQLIEMYLKRHVQLRQDTGALDEFFSKQADDLRARLSKTEEDLKKLKADAQVISLEDSKHAHVVQEARIKDDLFAAEAELAERQAALGQFVKTAPAPTDTNAPVPVIAPEKAEQYRMTVAECEAFRRREQELLMRFAAEHPFVLRIREQLQDAEARKRQLEEETPALLTIVTPATSSLPSSASTFDPAAETARVLSIQAKIKVLTNQLERVRAEASKVSDSESSIVALTRKREMEDTSYRDYTAKLQQARLEESLGAGKVNNIKTVQAPSPPARDLKEIQKPMLAALAFALCGGLALACLLEKVLSQSIKRVADLERTLRVPMLMAIPDMSRRKRFHRSSRNGHGPPPPSTTVQADAPPVEAHSSGREPAPSSRDNPATSVAVTTSGTRQVQPWDADHELRAHYEALRDRLITYFEVRNMTHKPKLVALTSCHKGAGVTTMAAGLAAALSETGDGNVLLVDMNLEQGAAHPFHRGKPAIGLSEAFEGHKPETGMVNENLYLVSAKETNDQKLPRVLLRRFANLVPKMKASDYDYIIFDMPPVSQTSITPRLSSFMDIVMMVVESEKTGQELAKRANALLQESKANVTAVLNKKRDYVPERLRQEL